MLIDTTISIVDFNLQHKKEENNKGFLFSVPQYLQKTYILATGIKLPPKQKAREEKEKEGIKKGGT
jgi:hypothetical protein